MFSFFSTKSPTTTNSTPKRVLRYASDIHLEMATSVAENKEIVSLYEFEEQPNTTYYLALLGDIGTGGKPSQLEVLKLFLGKVSSKYKTVFYVAGNHEYYSHRDQIPMATIRDSLRSLCSSFTNVVFMDNDAYLLDEYKILGTTLWSHVPDDKIHYIQTCLNDYTCIYKEVEDGGEKKLVRVTVPDTNKLHNQAVEWIEKELQSTNNSQKVIVLTHHAPLYSTPKKLLCDPKFLGGDNNCAFHSDLKRLMKDPIKVWLYGHTHWVSSFKENGVTVATNQRGYFFEKDIEAKYDPTTCIEL